MHGTSASPQRLNAAQRSAHIREVVLAKGVELRQRYPILKHQDALGAGILAFALAGMIGCAALYISGHMAWWACLLLNAFFASLTHELEHDLIHSMYFRKQRVPHNLMMGLVWLARPSTINPWIRRHLHLNHHKVSGSETDMEERAITNGEPWGFARLLMIGDNIMSAFIRMLRAKTWAHKFSIIKRTLKVYAPLALVHWGAWYVFLGFHAANGIAHLLGAPIEWSATTLSVMQRDRHRGRRDHRPERAAHVLPALHQLEHALLRRHRARERDAAVPGAERLVAVAVAGVLLQLRQQPRHPSLCGEGTVLHPPDDRAGGA